MSAAPSDARFGEAFRDVAVAWRALSSYPRGHPMVGEALGRAHANLVALLAEAGPLDLGAARDALLWGDRTFRTQPALLLARLLRGRGAAGLHLQPGASVEELEVLLRALSMDARAARDAGSMAAQLADAGLVHVRVTDLDLSSLALVETEEETTAPEAGAFESRVIRRLLAAGALGADEPGKWAAAGKSAADLLQLLFDPAGASRPDAAQLAAAASRAVSEELAEAPDSGRAAAVAELYAGVAPAVRERLLQDLAAAMTRRGSASGSLAALCAHLPPNAISELRQALRRNPAPGRGGERPAEAARLSAAQVAAIRQAFGDDDVDAHRATETPVEALAALLEIPRDPAGIPVEPAALEAAREIQAGGRDDGLLVFLLELTDRRETPIDSLPGVLKRLEGPYRRLLASGRLRDAARVAERIGRRAAQREPSAAPFREALERMSDRAAVDALVGALPALRDEAAGAFPALLGFLSPAAVGHLLDALAEEEDRRVRLRILDLSAKLGWLVGREAEARLSDPRWYVVRNMLLLLRRVGDVKSVPTVRGFVDHPDHRVRLEAIHNLFAFDAAAAHDLLARALDDPDSRQAEAALDLVGQYGIAEAVGPIVAFLQARDPLGRRHGARLRAIRALGAIGNPVALAGLDRVRSRFQLSSSAIEERREIYRTLAAYPEEARRPWIESGLRSRDAEVRRLSAVLASSAGGTR